MSARTRRGRVAAFLALLAGAAVLASCGGGAVEAESPAHPSPPPPPVVGDALLPPDAFLVGKLDLVRLRESASWDAISATLSVVEENLSRPYPSLGNGALMRWISETDRVFVGLTPSSRDEPDAFSVVEGRFTITDAERALGALGGDTPAFTPRAGADVVTFTGDVPFEEVALLADGLAVSATSGRLSEVLARRASTDARSPLARAEVASVAQRVDFGRDAISVAVEFTAEAKAAIGPRVDARIRAVVEVATAGALRVGLNDGIDALAIVTTTNPAVATAAVAEIERQRAMLGQQPVVQMMGLGSVISGLGASADDGDLPISLRTSQEDTRNLLGRLSGFIGLGIATLFEDAG